MLGGKVVVVVVVLVVVGIVFGAVVPEEHPLVFCQELGGREEGGRGRERERERERESKKHNTLHVHTAM